MGNSRSSYTFVLIVVSVYILFAFAIIVASYWWTIVEGGDIQDFTRTATIWATLLTSLLTAVISIHIVRRQINASVELERIKTEFDTNLEFLKTRFRAERKAYEELFGASAVYYYTLSRLEVGFCDEYYIGKAEEEMLCACRYIIAVDEEHADIWFKIWQKSRAISELAQDLKDTESRKQLWKENVREYGKLLQEFHGVALEKHKSCEN